VAIKLEELPDKINIASDLDEKTLKQIGAEVVENYNRDEESRVDWREKTEDWMKLALQVTEGKNFPWPGSANIKYPLLTIAALQFNARAYPSILPDQNPVKGKVIGFDPDGQKMMKAERIGKHMSYQLMEKMDTWNEDMDKLTLALPILGCMFKKIYYDPLNEVNKSEIIYPKHLVVNYYAKSLDDADCVTHVLEMQQNALKERQMAGIYLDIKLSKPNGEDIDQRSNANQGLYSGPDDKSTPYTLLEQHMWFDLDDDGYKEPYIAIVDLESAKVLRLVARFSTDGIKYNSDGTLRRIIPDKYFTKYSFIPNPDGGFYDLGFGLLLGPINETTNTIINQLIDAGTLSNLQGGFLARGVRIKGGDFRFRPGEWKVVNSTGDDLRKGIVPLPVTPPSNVLFQLLGMLVESGKQLSTISDIMTGEMPGQNTPATTTMAAVEQGLKVFNAIYKRIYRSLTSEYKLLFDLNKKYMSGVEEFTIVGTNDPAFAAGEDYRDEKMNVVPSADPNVSSEAQKLAKAQGLMELLGTGMINPQIAVKRILEAQQQYGIEELMNVQPPQPSVEDQVAMQEVQIKQFEAETERAKAQAQAELFSAQAIAAVAKAQVDALSLEVEKYKTMVDVMLKGNDQTVSVVKQLHEMDSKEADRQLQRETNAADLEAKKEMMATRVQPKMRPNNQ